MGIKRLIEARRFKSTWSLGLIIFCLTLTIFMISKVHQIADSQYSMLLSQSLLDHGSFMLDNYAIKRYEPILHGNYFRNGPIYQQEVVDGHIYYLFPPGTSILSAPFVRVLNIFGVSAAKPDGTFNPLGDALIQTTLAAILMAILASIFFYTARLLLTSGWSVIIALGGALGTQVYSTASRTLWSDTWGIFLLGIVIFLILRSEVSKLRPNPFLLGSLLSWMYFVRPTFAVPIFAISVYILIFHRQIFIRYTITGGLWLAAFIYYSWSHFGQLLPNYYRANRLEFNVFWTALAGNLVSPSRGVLVFVPVLFFVAYLLIRYRQFLNYPRLVWLSLSIIGVHLIAISGFSHWWGGHSFGPRFTTGLVPWFVLLGILGIRAMITWREKHVIDKSSLTIWRIQLATGGVLLMLSVIINTIGATDNSTWLWNSRPKDVDMHPERLWDWRQPQFLAKILPYPPPDEFPPVGTAQIDFSKPEAEKYLWYGWIIDESGFRCAERKAAIVFTSADNKSLTLRANVMPFLAPGKLNSQQVNILLNNQLLKTITLTEQEFQVHTLIFSATVLGEKNVLIFDIPEATSPQKLGIGEDPRPRGIKINWIEFEAQNEVK